MKHSLRQNDGLETKNKISLKQYRNDTVNSLVTGYLAKTTLQNSYQFKISSV